MGTMSAQKFAVTAGVDMAAKRYGGASLRAAAANATATIYRGTAVVDGKQLDVLATVPNTSVHSDRSEPISTDPGEPGPLLHIVVAGTGAELIVYYD